jgi:hypothetical protein
VNQVTLNQIKNTVEDLRQILLRLESTEGVSMCDAILGKINKEDKDATR